MMITVAMRKVMHKIHSREKAIKSVKTYSYLAVGN